MKSLGETIRKQREALGLTLSDLERETKIKKNFLQSIEDSSWNQLPELPVVQGFVRSIAQVIELDEKLTLALLRRDYPQKTVAIGPKPDVKNKFIWTPKWTLIGGIAIVILVIIGYLGYQYKQFLSPPVVVVEKPEEGVEIKIGTYLVEGRVSNDASVLVNNQPTVVSSEGYFVEEIEVTKETKEVVVKATSRSGKVTELKRNVTLKE